MEFRDLKAQYKRLKVEIDAAMIQVASESNFIMGTQVIKLEKKLANYVGVKHCITCANGTDALSLALMAWGIGKGDAVFLPDFTFFASGEVVSFEGATPIFVDVDEATYNIDCKKLVDQIERILKQGKLIPKVIIAVDLFGQPADYIELNKIAQKYNIKILEDAAQGFGGMIGTKRACCFGEISTTSFFPAKPLGCYGDGGAIFTDSDEIAFLIQSLKIHGKGAQKYDNVRIGVNSRLDTIQAAILEIKLKSFIEYELDQVNKVANSYTRLLKGIVKTPIVRADFYSSWAQYTIELDNEDIRDGLQAYLKERNIPTMVYYPKPMHSQKAFEEYEFNESDYLISNRLSKCVLSLPMHPYLENADILFVVDNVKTYLLD